MPRTRFDDDEDYQRGPPSRPKWNRLLLWLLVPIVAAPVLTCAGCFIARMPKTAKKLEEFDRQVKQAEEKGEGRAVALEDSATIGWLNVEIIRVRLGGVPVEMLTGPGLSNDDDLTIAIRITVTDPTRRFNYTHWTGRVFGAATLTDEFGNRYKEVNFGFGSRPRGAVQSAIVTAGEPATDVFVFDKPVPAATYLNFDLPENEAGPGSVFRFRIPRAAWAK